MSNTKWILNEHGVMQWDEVFTSKAQAVNAAYNMNYVCGGNHEVVSLDEHEYGSSIQGEFVYIIVNKWLNRGDVPHADWCTCTDCFVI